MVGQGSTVNPVTALSASTLTALLGIRLGEGPLAGVLDRLVHIARTAIPGADEVSITLVREERPWTAAYTGQLALDADELQYERGYGPCIDAGLSGTVLKWPERAEIDTPVQESLIVELYSK